MSDRELLERHKPILKFDPQYDFRALSASSALANPGNLLLREHGEVVARSRESAPLGLDVAQGLRDRARRLPRAVRGLSRRRRAHGVGEGSPRMHLRTRGA